MPEPGRAPEPLYKGLPYGANSLANARAADIPDGTDAAPQDELADFSPSTPEEQFLLGPTDRPDEPLSHGFSFGTGPSIPSASLQQESPNQFAQRVAQTLATEGESSPGLRKFLARIEKGL